MKNFMTVVLLSTLSFAASGAVIEKRISAKRIALDPRLKTAEINERVVSALAKDVSTSIERQAKQSLVQLYSFNGVNIDLKNITTLAPQTDAIGQFIISFQIDAGNKSMVAAIQPIKYLDYADLVSNLVIISDFRGVILDKYITCDKSFVANDRSRALVNADSGLELGKFVDTETRIYTSVRLPDDADGSVPAAPAPKAD